MLADWLASFFSGRMDGARLTGRMEEQLTLLTGLLT
jgi:hypothetical protein